MKEIEILFELKSDFEHTKTILNKFQFKGAKETIDYYYYDPLRNNLKLNSDNKLLECCRIRRKNEKYFVAYKLDHYENGIWIYSDEHETEFTNFDALNNVFKLLGLELLVTINNIKYTYETDKFEIVLEDVKELGYFLEVEYMSNEEIEDVKSIKNLILEFVKSLNIVIGNELNSGKPELLLLKQNKVIS